MVSDILIFSFLLIGASLVALIIDKLRQEICILFNITNNKKTRATIKKTATKKNCCKRTVSIKSSKAKKKTKVTSKNTSLKKTTTRPIKGRSKN